MPSTSSPATTTPPTSLADLLTSALHLLASPPPPPPPSQHPSTSTSASNLDALDSADLVPPSQSHPATRALQLLDLAARRADALSLFSDNDVLDDLPTSSLRALLIDSLRGHALVSQPVLPTTVGAEASSSGVNAYETRKQTLRHAEDAYTRYLSRLLQLHILPAPPRASSSSASPSTPLTFLSASAAACLRPPRGATEADPPPTNGSSSHEGTAKPTTSHATAEWAQRASREREQKIALLRLERSLQSSLDRFRTAYRERRASRRRRAGGGGAGGALRVQATGIDTGVGARAGAVAPSDAFWDVLYFGGASLDGGRATSSADGEEGNDAGRGADEDAEEDGSESDSEGASSAPSGDPTTGGGGEPPTIRSLRRYLVTLNQLHACRAVASLRAVAQERDMLASVPSSQLERDAREAQRAHASRGREAARGHGGEGDAGSSWKVDGARRRLDAADGAPLLDPRGRVLRPFQILPSSSSSTAAGGGGASTATSAEALRAQLGRLGETTAEARLRIASEVFRPSHRLPTMSIDEYLAEEARRGNILSGGGAEGAARPTPREAREVRAQMDGTRAADEADEERRREKVAWDEFAEEHRRGEGNSLSRRG